MFTIKMISMNIISMKMIGMKMITSGGIRKLTQDVITKRAEGR